MDRSHDDAERGYFQYVCQRCREPFFWPVAELGRSCPRCEPTTLEPPHQMSISSCYTRSSDQAQQRPTGLISVNRYRYTYNHDLTVMEPSVSQSRPDLYPSRQPRAHHKRRQVQLPGIRDIPVLKYALDTTRPKETDYSPPFLSFRSGQDALLSFQQDSQTSPAGQSAQHIQVVRAQGTGGRPMPFSPQYYRFQHYASGDSSAPRRRGRPRHHHHAWKCDHNEHTMNNVGNDRPLAIPDKSED